MTKDDSVYCMEDENSAYYEILYNDFCCMFDEIGKGNANNYQFEQKHHPEKEMTIDDSICCIEDESSAFYEILYNDFCDLFEKCDNDYQFKQETQCKEEMENSTNHISDDNTEYLEILYNDLCDLFDKSDHEGQFERETSCKKEMEDPTHRMSDDNTEYLEILYDDLCDLFDKYDHEGNGCQFEQERSCKKEMEHFIHHMSDDVTCEIFFNDLCDLFEEYDHEAFNDQSEQELHTLSDEDIKMFSKYFESGDFLSENFMECLDKLEKKLFPKESDDLPVIILNETLRDLLA